MQARLFIGVGRIQLVAVARTYNGKMPVASVIIGVHGGVINPAAQRASICYDICLLEIPGEARVVSGKTIPILPGTKIKAGEHMDHLFPLAQSPLRESARQGRVLQ